MRLSDLVSERILSMIRDSENGMAEIRRNELAEDLGCVPSQINYVLTSRFTPEHGYMVESRRGGGGYIRITRIHVDRTSAIMHLINSIGDRLDFATSHAILGNLVGQQALSPEAATLMAAALADRCYTGIPATVRDTLRARQLKQMLLTVV